MAKRRSKRETYYETVHVEPVRLLVDEPSTAIDEEANAQALAEALANTEAEDGLAGLAYALASQEVLARDWLTPEDDRDWSNWIVPTENYRI
jgi:hypothetical protein